ncbi:unnamed protein product [Cuscuta europaea]|uniref:Uncharacterized protein n=1 Tax=Cuscuta europaea TaxID=41803 RepID=A0A9P1EFB0_CUSEU|nr:unnamed protein product [Cuscuta europaea]
MAKQRRKRRSGGSGPSPTSRTVDPTDPSRRPPTLVDPEPAVRRKTKKRIEMETGGVYWWRRRAMLSLAELWWMRRSGEGRRPGCVDLGDLVSLMRWRRRIAMEKTLDEDGENGSHVMGRPGKN